jgi:hypothetical protein
MVKMNELQQLEQWDKTMIMLMGEKWHQLTMWQKMCEVASLQEYWKQNQGLSWLFKL